MTYATLTTPTVAPGDWIRVPWRGPDTAQLTLRLHGAADDTGRVPAYLDAGAAAIRCPDLPAGAYTVHAAADGGHERRAGTLTITR